MCKDFPVIPVVDTKRITGKKLRGKEERHKASPTCFNIGPIFNIFFV
jgi:hypothetical protein